MVSVRRSVFGPGGVIDVGGTEFPYQSRVEGKRLLAALLSEGTIGQDQFTQLTGAVDGPSQADQAMGSLMRLSASRPYLKPLVGIAGRVVLALTPNEPRP